MCVLVDTGQKVLLDKLGLYFDRWVHGSAETILF